MAARKPNRSGKRMGGCGCHFAHPPEYQHPTPGQDYRCMRCGYEWRGRRAPVVGVVPVYCPGCRSAYWVRAGRPKIVVEPVVERAPVPPPRQDHPTLTGRQDHPTELAWPDPPNVLLVGVDARLPKPEPSPALVYGVPPPPSVVKRAQTTAQPTTEPAPTHTPAPEPVVNDTMSALDVVEEDLNL